MDAVAERTGSTSGPRLALFAPNEAGDGGLLRGRLEVTGPCLHVVDDEGRSWLPAWPATASWDIETQSIRYGQTEVGLGVPASLGGGEGRIDTSSLDDDDWVQAA